MRMTNAIELAAVAALLAAGPACDRPAATPAQAARPAASATRPGPAGAKAARPGPAGAKAAARAGRSPAARPASLYDRLGGLPAIRAVVADFVGRTTTDPRIKERFFNTDATHLKAMLVEQICQATGGPCHYSGRDMKTVHGGMELVDAEWNALVEDLTAALDRYHVPARERHELLGALAGMKPQVVTPASQLHPIPERALARAAHLAHTLAAAHPRAAELLSLAVTAGRRGQRSYAEQLFSRAELLVGAHALASAAPVFRRHMPPRVTTPLTALPLDTPPQPEGAVGSSDEDAQPAPGAASSLAGRITIGGAPLKGVGAVMLTPVKGHHRHRTPKQRAIEQRGREFRPHLMAVPVGSTVSFPNFDPFYHNVFSLSAPAAFDLGLYKNGETRGVKMNRPGVVRVGCNLHPSMSAFIIVVSAPHYAVTDGRGRFAFRRLEPGTYRLEAWSELSAHPAVEQVAIRPGQNHLSITMDNDAPHTNPNKFGDERLTAR